MKKRCLLAVLLVLVMLLSGCGGQPATQEVVSEETSSVVETVSSETVSEETLSEETISEISSIVEKAEENTSNDSQATSSQEIVSETSNVTKMEETDSNESEKEPEITFETVNAGDKITTDDIEMTIDAAAENKKIENPNATGYFVRYMDAGENETYIYFSGTIKNVGTQAISFDEMRVDVLIDDKFEYSGHITAQDRDDGDISSLGTYLRPFESTVYYIYVSVPDELISSYKTCKFDFGFKKEFVRYSPVLDDWDDCEYRYTITIAK